MPRANWGISSSDVDDFDRDSQFKPYMGPLPPSGVVYLWTIKKLVRVAATDDKVAQLRIGLELKPQTREQKKFKGYYITNFLPVTDNTAFRYTPLLDAFGVSGRDFTTRTIIDEQGNIQKIGKWRNTGDFVIAAQLHDNDPDYVSKNPKKIGWMGEAPEDSDVDDDENESIEDEEDDDVPWDDDDSEDESEEDEYEEEEEQPRSRRRATGTRHTRARMTGGTIRKRRR